MRSRNLILVAAAFAVLGLIAWGITTASSQEPAQSEEQAPTAFDPLGIGGDRLVGGVIAYGDAGSNWCVYDAEVRFEDGNVGEIKLIGDRAKDRIHTGDPISDLLAGMEEGATIPIPVHIGDDGKIRPGYDYCEEMP